MLCHVIPSIPPRVPCHVSLSLGGFRLAFLRPLCPSIHFCVKNHVTFFRMNWKEKRRAALPYQQVSDVVSVVFFFFCIACISKIVKCHTSVPYDGEIKVGSSFDENTNRKSDRLQLFLFKSSSPFLRIRFVKSITSTSLLKETDFFARFLQFYCVSYIKTPCPCKNLLMQILKLTWIFFRSSREIEDVFLFLSFLFFCLALKH